jgi:hypothetical protein
METIPQIKAYFDAKGGDVHSIDDCFADDVCIEDTGEDKTINGADDCKKWIVETNERYRLATEIVEMTNQDNGDIKVSVLSRGNFAPSAFPFDYFFTIRDGKIKKVKIIYTGE